MFERTARLPLAGRFHFVSDLHLGDGGPSDAFGRKDDRLRSFLDEVASRGDALVIVGDGFDIAQAWSLERIVAAHRAVIDDLCALSRTTPVYYLRGNHEGSGSELVDALPLRFAHELTIGERIRVEHGNAHDPHNLPGNRKAFWGARIHATVEAAIRTPVRIPMRKHHYWSTRLGHWMFYRFGQLQLGLSHIERALGRDEQARKRLEFLDYWGRGEWGDAHGLVGVAHKLLAVGDIDTLVCGHSHQPGTVAIAGGTYVNTGSWTFEDSTYAAYEDGRFEVRRYPERSVIADEEYRSILGPNRGKSFFDWWDAYYRGFLRYDVDAMWRDCGG